MDRYCISYTTFVSTPVGTMQKEVTLARIEAESYEEAAAIYSQQSGARASFNMSRYLRDDEVALRR